MSALGAAPPGSKSRKTKKKPQHPWWPPACPATPTRAGRARMQLRRGRLCSAPSRSTLTYVYGYIRVYTSIYITQLEGLTSRVPPPQSSDGQPPSSGALPLHPCGSRACELSRLVSDTPSVCVAARCVSAQAATSTTQDMASGAFRRPAKRRPGGCSPPVRRRLRYLSRIRDAQGYL